MVACVRISQRLVLDGMILQVESFVAAAPAAEAVISAMLQCSYYNEVCNSV